MNQEGKNQFEHDRQLIWFSFFFIGKEHEYDSKAELFKILNIFF